MKPPYRITTEILNLITSISQKLGEVQALYLDKPKPSLRKQNRVKTIHASLKIEGNSLSEKQVTGLIDGTRVIAPEKDIKEVTNAIAVYEALNTFDPTKEASLLKAHRLLMEGLLSQPGQYRKESVGIAKGSEVSHIAPPFERVPFLIQDLLNYLESDEPCLIKSFVFHYELEFIHPFIDGNGRMGRLWQTLILSKEYPIFEYLPFETMISANQANYYQILSACDRAGESTQFIVYMLHLIEDSLTTYLETGAKPMTAEDRLLHYISIGKTPFSRKDYQRVFKTISSPTASRDLQLGVSKGYLYKTGNANTTRYQIKTDTNTT